MKIRIDLKILFFLALFTLTKQLHIYIIMLFFALLHELAHILIARLLGFKIEYIEAMPFGFWISLKPKIEDYKIKVKKTNIIEIKYIFVALAGPLLNLIIAIVLAKSFNINEEMLKCNDAIFTFKQNLIYSNFLIFLINLIPIYPLDGGRILKSFLKIYIEKKEVEKVINIIANLSIIILTFISSIAILYLKNLGVIIILAYLWGIVLEENKRFKLKKEFLINNN